MLETYSSRLREGDRLYVAGGITGVPDPLARFTKAANVLFDAGYLTLLPQEVPACPDMSCMESPAFPRRTPQSHTFACALRYDLIAMLQCDGVAVLPFWEQSRGTLLEVNTALAVGMPILFLHPDDLGEKSHDS